MKGTKAIIVFIPAIIVLALDQLTKYLALNLHSPVSLGFFKLSLVSNTGAGFGMLKGFNSLFIWTTIIIIGMMLYYYDKYPDKKYFYAGIGFILGGGIGNLIDRAALGYVVDFIDLTYWPAFNIADSFITIGAVLIGYYLFFENK